MKIAIASDHGGFLLKENLKKYLKDKGHEMIDLGTDSEESCDYPDFGHLAANYVIDKKCDFAIVVCGTGIGISISANKVKGIRCALCFTPEMGHLAKEHNNANMIALGGRTTSDETAQKIIDAYLEAEFGGGRHERRVNKIEL